MESLVVEMCICMDSGIRLSIGAKRPKFTRLSPRTSIQAERGVETTNKTHRSIPSHVHYKSLMAVMVATEMMEMMETTEMVILKGYKQTPLLFASCGIFGLLAVNGTPKQRQAI
eukprot:5835813-Ditylum_brightwellii.AAC.1